MPKPNSKAPRKAPNVILNAETKNDQYNLKPEILTKKAGGLLLNWTGAKVEFVPGACGARRDKFISSPMPSFLRGYSCPWLGPNLRLASEIQMLWTAAKLKKPVTVFIPFNFSAVLELTREEATVKTEEAMAKAEKVAREVAKEAEAIAMAEKAEKLSKEKVNQNDKKFKQTISPAPFSKSPKAGEKRSKKGKHEKNKPIEYVQINSPILDTRTVFVLQSKIGETTWKLKQNVVIVQPTIHHLEWPARVLKAAYKAGRFSEREDHGRDIRRNSKTVTSMNLEAISPNAKSKGDKRKSGGKQQEPSSINPKDTLSPLEVAKKAENFAGGICFEADEFSDFVAIVIATRSEAIEFDKEGGLLRSPLLHPQLTIRIPKLAMNDVRASTFKVVEIRKNLIPALQHFDIQLNEVNECSDIYELDLGDKPFDRPITINLPIPDWYIDMIEQIKKNKLKIHTEELTSANETEDMPKTSVSGDKLLNEINVSNDDILMEERPKNLMLLYQDTSEKRQIVWRIADGDANSDMLSNRRKTQKTGKFRDTTSSAVMKGEQLNAKNGWMQLMLGVRGGTWKPVPINGPFTPRTLQINTLQMGRFAFLHNNDPLRTPASKIAHLMGRMEALSVAPPGVFLVCLQNQGNRITLWVNIVPSSKVIDVLEERLSLGFIPLVQTNASPSRKAAALANILYQNLPQLIPPLAPDEEAASMPVYGISKFRVNGYDMLRVLLYNGLCIQISIKGFLQIHTSGAFDALQTVVDFRRKTRSSNTERARSMVLVPNTASLGTDILNSSRKLGATAQPHVEVVPVRDVKQPEEFLTKSETRFCYNDLFQDTAIMVELEPTRIAHNYASEMKIKRLSDMERDVVLSHNDLFQDTAIMEQLESTRMEHIYASEMKIKRDKLVAGLMNRRVQILESDEPKQGGNVNARSSKADTMYTDSTLTSKNNNTSINKLADGETTEEGQDDGEEKVKLPAGYDGDDKVTPSDLYYLQQVFTSKYNARKAFEVSKDVCRRLFNIVDTNKADDAKDFIKEIHSCYTLGRVEIRLIQPNELAQIREKLIGENAGNSNVGSKRDDEHGDVNENNEGQREISVERDKNESDTDENDDSSNYQASNKPCASVVDEQVNISPFSYLNEDNLLESAMKEGSGEENEDCFEDYAENQHNQGKRSEIHDENNESDNGTEPLARFDILIDPDNIGKNSSQPRLKNKK